MLLDDLKSKVNAYFSEPYEVQETTIVPGQDYSKLTFGNNGLTCEFAFLFVDIRKSSKLHVTYGLKNAAKIYQSFHEICVRIISANNGNVRAFDGDRVMGVFAGDKKNDNALEAALQIQWSIRYLLNTKLPSPLRCGIGIDYGKTLVTKVGKGRDLNNQDLVWVGEASNYASHLCQEADGAIIVSDRTYRSLSTNFKHTNNRITWRYKVISIKGKSGVSCWETTSERSVL